MYSDDMDADDQVSTEEAIAAALFHAPDTLSDLAGAELERYPEAVCAELGRRILHIVIAKFRRDLLAPYEVPAALDAVFTAQGYWLDSGETDADCAGYSRYRKYIDAKGLDQEAYCFAVVDDEGVQVYAEHELFRKLTASKDGAVHGEDDPHLNLAVETKDPHTVDLMLKGLDTAVEYAFTILSED